MSLSGLTQRRATARDLCIFESPTLWRYHPYLPVVRPLPGGEERECGVLYDARGVSGTYGYACTVFLANLHDPAVCGQLLEAVVDVLRPGVTPFSPIHSSEPGKECR